MKATMPKRPEPDGYLTIRMIGREVEVNAYRDSTMDAYTEAYANARVREALELAAGIIRANAEACDSGTRIMLRANAEAVLALLPSTPARPESEQ